jgi:hypothetical protein
MLCDAPRASWQKLSSGCLPCGAADKPAMLALRAAHAVESDTVDAARDPARCTRRLRARLPDCTLLTLLTWPLRLSGAAARERAWSCDALGVLLLACAANRSASHARRTDSPALMYAVARWRRCFQR